MSKTFRLSDRSAAALAARRIELIIGKRQDVKESDLLGALIWLRLNDIGFEEVERYRKEVLGKNG